MAGVQKARSKVNVVMNRLVGEGLITGFKTSFDSQNEVGAPHVTATVAEGQSLEEARLLVMDALMEAVIGINVIVERA